MNEQKPRIVDVLTSRSVRLQSLLAMLAIACQNENLPNNHVSAVIDLAGDLADEIAAAVNAIAGV